MARNGLYKRGNVWWLMFADLSGKTIRKSSGTSAYREAETMLIAEQKAVREGKQTHIIKIKNHTFYELKEKYLTWMRGRHKSADSKEYRIEQMATVKELLGHKDLKTTLHLAPAHKRGAVSVLDNLLNPTPNSTPETNFTIDSQSTKKVSAYVS